MDMLEGVLQGIFWTVTIIVVTIGIMLWVLEEPLPIGNLKLHMDTEWRHN